jgi:putative DNA primase/helicase
VANVDQEVLHHGGITGADSCNHAGIALAKWYASKFGFAMIPVGHNKVPLVRQWQRIKAGPFLEQEWVRQPSRNLGCVTGSASQVVVLDVDVSHGQNGMESLKLLEERFGTLPKTPTVRTPSGGEHYYFRYAGPSLKRRIKFREGLDFLAEESYAMLPPSVGANGRAYCWDVDAHIEEVSFAPLPQWLIEVTQENQLVHVSRVSPSEWQKLVSQGVTEGNRNDTLTRISGHLLRSHVDPYVVRELILCLNAVRLSPPLPEKEVIQVVDSIVKKEFQRRKALQGAD